MSNLLNLRKVKILAITMVALSLLVVGFAVQVQKAHADGVSDLANCPTLSVGSTSHSCVMILQAALNANGASPALTVDGSFGAHTKAAVMAYQSAHSLLADGIAGMHTKAALMGSTTATTTTTTVALCPNGNTLASNCMTAPTTTTTVALCPNGNTIASNCMTAPNSTTVTNNGTVGNIDTDTTLGGFSSEQVGVGDMSHQVFGLELKASAGGSAVNVSALTLQMVMNPSNSTSLYGGSGYFSKYFQGVSIWQGSTKVGSASASDFGQNTSSTYNNYLYSKTINLSGVTIAAGQKVQLYVAVDSLPVIDSNNLGNGSSTTGNIWGLAITNIRFMDGTGASLTYSPTSGAQTITTNLFQFVSTATANNIKLTVSRPTDDMNANVQQVSLTASTSKLQVQKVNLAATGQKVHIDKLQTVFTTSGSLYGIASTVYLMNGSTVLDSEVIPSTDSGTSNTITFKNLGLDINAGSSDELTVAADINGLTGNFLEGATIASSVAATGITAIDQNSNQLSGSSQLSGSATGQANALYDIGLKVTPTSVTVTHTGSPSTPGQDLGTFTIAFNVTAFGGTVYVPNAGVLVATATPSAANDFALMVAKSSAPGTGLTTGAASVSIGNNSISAGTNSNWILNDGQTAPFTAVVTQADSSTTTGQYRAWLTNVYWATSDTASPTNLYNFNLGPTNSQFTTNYVGLN